MLLAEREFVGDQTAESVRIKASLFRNHDRTCILIEKVFRREKSSGKKLVFDNPWSVEME